MHQLPSGEISEANRREDRASTAGRPGQRWTWRADAAVPDVPSGDQHGRRLRAWPRDLAARTFIDVVAGPDKAADLPADEGPGAERRPPHRRGDHRAHENRSERALG